MQLKAKGLTGISPAEVSLAMCNETESEKVYRKNNLYSVGAVLIDFTL